jgi:hypothetical protein
MLYANMSDRTGSPEHRSDGAAFLPSAFMLPTDEGRSTADRTISIGGTVASSAGGGVVRLSHPVPVHTSGYTASMDGIGACSQNTVGLGAVPEDSRMEDDAPAFPDEPDNRGAASQELVRKVLSLCNAVVQDRRADEFTKQQALLLRCEANEHLLNL